MAVTLVKEVWDGRDAEFGDQFDRKYTRKFRVETNSVATSSIAVGFAPGIPRVFSFYINFATGEIDYLARCRRVQPVQRSDAPLVWDVTCEYETVTGQPADGSGVNSQSNPTGDPNKPGSGGAADNPEMRPPVRKWRFETIHLPLDRALDPNGVHIKVPFTIGAGVNGVTDYLFTDRWVPVLNSAGQRFDPFPTYEVGVQILDITRLELNDSPSERRNYAYAVNSDDFLFANPGEAQMLPITADEVWIGGVPYWEKHYQIRFVPVELKTWQPLILDAGRKQLQGNPTDKTKPPVAIPDPLTQMPVTEDVPLNGFGKVLPQQTVLNGPLVYMKYLAYPSLPFAALDLPV